MSISEHSDRCVLTVGGLLEVDVRVTERAAGHHVPADPDGEDGPGWTELLVQHGLGHIRVQIAHIQRGHRVTGSTGIHLRDSWRHGPDGTHAHATGTARLPPRRRLDTHLETD